jgi:hypothetical protein
LNLRVLNGFSPDFFASGTLIWPSGDWHFRTAQHQRHGNDRRFGGGVDGK